MRPLTVKLMLVLLATLLMAWFFYSHEKRTVNEYVGYSGEATYNNFFAAEQLLEQVGVEAETKASLTPTLWMPSVDDTIISRVSSGISTGEELSEILDWVNEGGHLVILPGYQPLELSEDFFDVIGAAFTQVEFDEDEDEDETDDDTDERFANATEIEGNEDIDYTLNVGYSFIRVELIAEGNFEATLSDDLGYVAGRRPWGNGYITVIAESGMFANYQLDEQDHARFFLDSVAGYLEPGKVWFVLDSSFPSLWALIWKHGYLVVIAAGVALLLWLWSILPRFGPPIESKIAERRSILEHIAAAGHFAWKNRGTAALARSSAKALVHEVDRKIPGFGRMSPDEQARYVARQTGVPAEQILELLMAREESRHREFTRNAQLIQRVRKKL